LAQAVEDLLFHGQKFGNELILALIQVAISFLGGSSFLFKLTQQRRHALGMESDRTNIIGSHEGRKSQVIVLVAQAELLQYNFLALLLITRFLLEASLAFFVLSHGVKFNVLGAVHGTRSNVFHEGGIAALGTLLAVLSNALDSTFSFDNLGASRAVSDALAIIVTGLFGLGNSDSFNILTLVGRGL
jgi:hypothetical protein